MNADKAARNVGPWLMPQVIFFLILIVFMTHAIYSQSTTRSCKVNIEDFNIDEKKVLGVIDIDVQKPTLATKAFKFLDTKLYVNASVAILNSNISSAKPSPDTLVLMIALSARQYMFIEGDMKRNDGMVTNSRTRLPLNLISHARIETIYIEKPEPIIISLSCADH